MRVSPRNCCHPITEKAFAKIYLPQILQFRNDILKIFDATYPVGPKDSFGVSPWICRSGLTQTSRHYGLDRLPMGQKVH